MTGSQVTHNIRLRSGIKVEDEQCHRIIGRDPIGLVHVAGHVHDRVRSDLVEAGQNRGEQRLVRFQNEKALFAFILSGGRFFHGAKRRGR